MSEFQKPAPEWIAKAYGFKREPAGEEPRRGKPALVEYKLLPLEEWRRQALEQQEQEENMPFWTMLLLLIAGMVENATSEAAKPAEHP